MWYCIWRDKIALFPFLELTDGENRSAALKLQVKNDRYREIEGKKGGDKAEWYQKSLTPLFCLYCSHFLSHHQQECSYCIQSSFVGCTITLHLYLYESYFVMTQGLTPRRFSGGKYALDNLFGYVSFLLILIFTHLTVNLSYYNNIVRRNLLNFITFSIIFICTFIYNRFRLL